MDEDGGLREWVLSGGYDGRVQLWDWKDFEIARVLREDPDRRAINQNLVSATHSPDGEWIVTASETRHRHSLGHEGSKQTASAAGSRRGMLDCRPQALSSLVVTVSAF